MGYKEGSFLRISSTDKQYNWSIRVDAGPISELSGIMSDSRKVYIHKLKYGGLL